MNQSDIQTHLQGFRALNVIQPLKSIYIKENLISNCCSIIDEIDVYEGNEEGQSHGQAPVIKCINDDGQMFYEDFILNITQQGSDDQIIMQLYQQFQCCKPCNVEIILINKEIKQKIGSISSPFAFSCNGTTNIMDQHDELRYYIICRCCQVGYLCPCSCRSCMIIRFQIYDNNNQQVAELQRICKGCYQRCCNQIDGYFLKFPSNASGLDKLLLMAAVILIDINYFHAGPLKKI